ncbi:DsbA family protein [Marinobacteraceae bacterium S3BR75-40.1]
MLKTLMPYLARTLSSNRLRDTRRYVHEAARRLQGAPHRLQVFLRLDDPYSALLVQALPDLLERFDIELQFHTVLHLDPSMFPAPEMWRANAMHDAAHLAHLYDLPYEPQGWLDDEGAIEAATAALLEAEGNAERYLRTAHSLFSHFWVQPSARLGSLPEYNRPSRLEQLAHNERQLREEGHYLSAMIGYGGEWYWGLDRLDHLERRLIALGAARQADPEIHYDRTYRDFCRHSPPSARPRLPLVLYWSARSPYSYIGLERAVQLAHHYRIELQIKPVLPMVTRGMAVPKTKKMYIFLDTKREAEKLGLPYGFVADPLGRAVERCYALVDFAREAGKLEDFLLSFARGVNAEGIRAETDRGLRKIVERFGLSWHEAREQLRDENWRHWAQQNLEEMLALGCWGVPSFRYGDRVFWGQDRIGLIEQAIIGDTLAHN